MFSEAPKSFEGKGPRDPRISLFQPLLKKNFNLNGQEVSAAQIKIRIKKVLFCI